MKLPSTSNCRRALHLETDKSAFPQSMHLSKLQGKRSLGLSALLAQRQSDAKPIGPPQSPGDEPSSESKFHVSDDPSFPDQTFAPMAQRGLLTYQEEASSLTAASISETAEVQILPDYDVSTSAGVANWPLYGDQCAGTATWQLGDSLVESQVIVQPQSQNQQASEAQTISISPLLTSQADVNIFYQNSRDISAIFVEKQKKMIVDLNAAAASLKLQLQFMQQERDDAVLEVSTLHVTIEEQKHEQQTQLLSFSLKMLQDEAEMRKLNDKIHAMSGETNMYSFLPHVIIILHVINTSFQVSAMLKRYPRRSGTEIIWFPRCFVNFSENRINIRQIFPEQYP